MWSKAAPFLFQFAGIVGNIVFIYCLGLFAKLEEYNTIRVAIVQGGVFGVFALLGLDNTYIKLYQRGKLDEFVSTLLTLAPVYFAVLMFTRLSFETISYSVGIFTYYLGVQKSRLSNKVLYFFLMYTFPKIFWFIGLFLYYSELIENLTVILSVGLLLTGIVYIIKSDYSIQLGLNKVVMSSINGLLPVLFAALVFRAPYFIGENVLNKSSDIVFSVLLTSLIPFSIFRVLSENPGIKGNYISSYVLKNRVYYSFVVFIFFLGQISVLCILGLSKNYDVNEMIATYIKYGGLYFFAAFVPNKLHESLIYFDSITRRSKILLLSGLCLLLIMLIIPVESYTKHVALFLWYIVMNVVTYEFRDEQRV